MPIIFSFILLLIRANPLFTVLVAFFREDLMTAGPYGTITKLAQNGRAAAEVAKPGQAIGKGTVGSAETFSTIACLE